MIAGGGGGGEEAKGEGGGEEEEARGREEERRGGGEGEAARANEATVVRLGWLALGFILVSAYTRRRFGFPWSNDGPTEERALRCS